jgi:hypothetical protein
MQTIGSADAMVNLNGRILPVAENLSQDLNYLLLFILPSQIPVSDMKETAYLFYI